MMKTSPAIARQRHPARHTRGVARFLRRHAGPDYDGFSPDVLEEYLEFHEAQGTLAWNHRSGRIMGAATAWQCHEEELRAAEEAGVNPFQWRPDNPAGDSLFIANVCARTPLALAGLLAAIPYRWPHWRRLHIWTYRHGQLTRLAPAALLRLMRRSCL